MSRIIGLKGQSGSGKDTVGDFLVYRHAFRKMAFADPLKEMVAVLTGWSSEMIQGTSKESRDFRETVIHPDFGMTCREILQSVGTNLFRTHFDPETWVKIARRRILQAIEDNRDIVVTDIRFENEAKIIKDLGGEIWNIKRDLDLTQVLISETAAMHISEQLFEIDGEKTIKNNGTLLNLYSTIDELLNKET